MIAVALLHPHQATPVHRWTFERGAPVRIGRAADNDVVLYSAVISRRHLELVYEAGGWWAVNYGKNGTYANGLSFDRLQIGRPITFRLAKSGPRLEIAPVQRRATVPANDPGDTTLVLADNDSDEMTLAEVSAPFFELRAP